MAHVQCSYCDSVGGCPKESTFGAFRLPQLLAMNRDIEDSCEPNSELGVDEAYLPVTHVGGPKRGPTDSGGLWFYYARGCSDLLWHMGRTMLARNRVHAAVLVEQRLALLDGKRITDREAVGRVATYVRSRQPRWNALGHARGGFLGKNATVEDAIAEASRGLYGLCKGPAFTMEGQLRACACLTINILNATHNRAHAAHSRRSLGRSRALASMAGDKIISLHSEPLLRRLPLDTLVLHKQPQGGGKSIWTTEMWDLRGSPALSRHLENATAHPEVVARSRWARGSTHDASRAGPSTTVVVAPCEPSAAWHTCMACRGSLLERSCNGTVQWYARHERGRG